MKKSDLIQDYKDLQSRVELNMNSIHECHNEINELYLLDQPNWNLIKKLNEEIDTKLLINQMYLKTIQNLKKMIKQDQKTLDLIQEDYGDFDRIEMLEKTKEKEILFNMEHPYFDDMDFYEEVFDHFKNAEEYEMCRYLLNVKK